MSTSKIPMLTSLTVSLTVTACADPIVGDWSLSELCTSEMCIDLPGALGYYELEANMSINSDLTGTMTQVISDEYQTETYNWSLTVESLGSNAYKINNTDEDVSLNCNLDSALLDCNSEDEGYDYQFTKK